MKPSASTRRKRRALGTALGALLYATSTAGAAPVQHIVDLGLSPEQIAHYFSVSVTDVTNAIGAHLMPLPIGR